MSGGSGGGPWKGDGGSDCGKLKFAAVLASPRKPAIQTVKVGDVADVEICKEQDKSFVGVRQRPGGAIVGSITDRVPELLRCLQAGHTFHARFTAIAGGRFTLRVEFVK